MFQSFEVTARPEQGPPRLRALRAELTVEGLDGFLVPRADAHQGEYVAAHDDRLAWLTGFTGSAGFCCVLHDIAGVFIDGRYRTQVKAQVAADFTPVPWPEVSLGNWLKEQLPAGGTVGFDAWLHTPEQIAQAEDTLKGTGIILRPCVNLVDRIWVDQPAPPMFPAKAHPIEFAGETHVEKRQRLAQSLCEAHQKAAVITLPDSHNWLLNIRGADIARNPVAHGFAVLHDDATVDLFMALSKLDDLRPHLGDDVRCHAPEQFLDLLQTLGGPVRLDKQSVPVIVADTLGDVAVWEAILAPCPRPARMPQKSTDLRRHICAMGRPCVNCWHGSINNPPALLQKRRWSAGLRPRGARTTPCKTSVSRPSPAPARTAQSCITASPKKPTANCKTGI